MMGSGVRVPASALSAMLPRCERLADPYRDLDVIDARAPRFNQATIGLLSVVAVVMGWWWLLALLAAQLAIGLTLGGGSAFRASPTSSSSSRASAKAGSGRPAATVRKRRRRAVPLGRDGLLRGRISACRGGAGLACRHPCAARGGDGLLHGMRGVQARLVPARPAVRLVPVPPRPHATCRLRTRSRRTSPWPRARAPPSTPEAASCA